MKSINKTELCGRVGTVEVKDSTYGKIGTYSLATGGKFKNQQGKEIDTTQWHRIKIFGDQPQVTKGDWLHVTGPSKNKKYTKKDGTTAYDYYVDGKEFTVTKKAAPTTMADEEDVLL